MKRIKFIVFNILFAIHFVSLLAIVILIGYFADPSTAILVNSFLLGTFISAFLIVIFYRKTLLGWKNVYFKIIAVLPLIYIGIWLILMPLLIH